MSTFTYVSIVHLVYPQRQLKYWRRTSAVTAFRHIFYVMSHRLPPNRSRYVIALTLFLKLFSPSLVVYR